MRRPASTEPKASSSAPSDASTPNGTETTTTKRRRRTRCNREPTTRNRSTARSDVAVGPRHQRRRRETETGLPVRVPHQGRRPTRPPRLSPRARRRNSSRAARRHIRRLPGQLARRSSCRRTQGNHDRLLPAKHRPARHPRPRTSPNPNPPHPRPQRPLPRDDRRHRRPSARVDQNDPICAHDRPLSARGCPTARTHRPQPDRRRHRTISLSGEATGDADVDTRRTRPVPRRRSKGRRTGPCCGSRHSPGCAEASSAASAGTTSTSTGRS